MIKIEVTGTDETATKLGDMPGNIRAQLQEAITRLSLEAVGRAKQKLSGDVLHVKTGNLRNSINYRIANKGKAIVGIIGTNVSYARAHEYGFDGVVQVKTFMRRSRAQMDAAKYSYRNNKGEKVTKTRMTGQYGRGAAEVLVRAHTRHMRLPERSFLRSTLKDMAVTIRYTLLNAVKEGTK